MKKFSEELRRLGQVSPAEDFRERAKIRLFKQIATSDEAWFSEISDKLSAPAPGMSLRFSFVKRFLQAEQREGSSSWWPRIFVPAGVLAVFLLSFTSFFALSSPTSAGEKTYAESVMGIVEISTDGENFRALVADETLIAGTYLRTGDGSQVSVAFFEGSVLRLDENTEIKINKLLPHPLVSGVGGVSVDLFFGRVWLKSPGEQSDYAGFEVRSGDIIVSPEYGVLDIYRNGNSSLVRIFERSAKIAYRGERERETTSLIAEKKMRSSLTGLGEAEDITVEDRAESWVKKNLEADKKHFEYFLAGEISYGEGILTRIHQMIYFGLRPDSAEKFLELAKIDFRNAVAFLDAGDKAGSEEALAAFFARLDGAVAEDPAIQGLVEAELRKMRKNFHNVLPTDNLFPAKKALEQALGKVALSAVSMQEELNKEVLWEVHGLAMAKDYEKASEHLQTFKKKSTPFADLSDDPSELASVLGQKSEELQIISELQGDALLNGETVEQVTNEIIADVVEVSGQKTAPVRPGFPGSAKKSATDELVKRIQVYSSPVGQENALRQILKNFENDAAAIAQLKELREQVAPELQPMISAKMVEILKTERQKALMEAN